MSTASLTPLAISKKALSVSVKLVTGLAFLGNPWSLSKGSPCQSQWRKKIGITLASPLSSLAIAFFISMSLMYLEAIKSELISNKIILAPANSALILLSHSPPAGINRSFHVVILLSCLSVAKWLSNCSQWQGMSFLLLSLCHKSRAYGQILPQSESSILYEKYPRHKW